MGDNKWKIIAITFIVLFTLETAFIIYAFNLGVESEEKEYICSTEICYNNGAASYDFNTVTNTCSCYDNELKVLYKEIIK